MPSKDAEMKEPVTQGLPRMEAKDKLAGNRETLDNLYGIPVNFRTNRTLIFTANPGEEMTLDTEIHKGAKRGLLNGGTFRTVKK